MTHDTLPDEGPPDPPQPLARDGAPDRSILRAQSGRPDLLIFEIVAKITKDDIEWMAAHVGAAFDIHRQIDMLIVMRHFAGAEIGAIVDPEAMKVQIQALRQVRRYCVVGAPLWAAAMINLLSPLTPVEEKTFPIEEEAQARAWIDSLTVED